MSGRFPFTRLAKYPHMKPLDIAVWERFIDQNPGYFDSVDYDVPVGTGAPTDPSHPPEIQADHTILTQKKIDAVGYRDTRITLVEVKPIADARGLGQMLTYSHLYAESHPYHLAVTRLLVCGEVEREMEPIYAAQGVEIEVAAPTARNS